MDKNIFATIVWCDEAETLGIVEPLYRSLHCVILATKSYSALADSAKLVMDALND
jgi:hypothetical protein